ncbi:hypothetical protein J4P02_28055 [Pseudomonas sp. NFXW11]
MLSVVDNPQIPALRRLLKEAYCVFDFIVLEVAAEARVDLQLHREALDALYRQLQEEACEARRRLRQDPRYADIGEPEPMRWEVQRAEARVLDPEQVQQLAQARPLEGHQGLYRAFLHPPYGTRFAADGEPPEAIFQRWLTLLGLEPQAQPEVIDWVANLQLDWQAEETEGPEVLPWSVYFDEGLEWWGVWCLSIWNPERRTLAVLMASATD